LGEGSETFHNNIRERWRQGDPEVVQAMKDFASYAAAARELLLERRGREIGPLLDANFERRRSIYTLDPRNIDMVERARSVGAHAKFAGSGGAIVGTYEDDAMFERLVKVFQEADIAVFKPRIEP